MAVSVNALQRLVETNVVELVFTRRVPKMRWPMHRRMLCTLDRRLLQSLPGRLTLHFRVPTHPPPYDYKSKGLVCVWDIFWQDYRMVPTESVEVVAVQPTGTPRQRTQFWQNFEARFHDMTAGEKNRFMKS